MHCEGSSDYHLIVLRSFVGTIANARLAGIPVPRGAGRSAPAPCATWPCTCSDPTAPPRHSPTGTRATTGPCCAGRACLLDRPDLLWAASGGAEGTPPATRSASFPVGGYFVQRSGWGDADRAYADERWSVLDCGPIGEGGHGHYDQLSVELMADGRPIVVDPGRYTYAEDDHGWRAWFKGTAAHNTVTVDGLDQTPYRRGKPKGPTSTATLLWRHTEPGLDVLCGRVESPRYDAVHTRTLAFVDDDHWVVHDRLRAPIGPRLHRALAPRPVRARPGGGAGRHGQTVVTTPSATLVVPRGYGEVDLAPGWVSPAYGVKHPAPVVRVSRTAGGRRPGHRGHARGRRAAVSVRGPTG